MFFGAEYLHQIFNKQHTMLPSNNSKEQTEIPKMIQYNMKLGRCKRHERTIRKHSYDC